MNLSALDPEEFPQTYNGRNVVIKLDYVIPEHIYFINTGVSISTLWPATVIKSHVTEKGNVPDKFMRTPEIFADAVLGIVNEPSQKYA